MSDVVKISRSKGSVMCFLVKNKTKTETQKPQNKPKQNKKNPTTLWEIYDVICYYI